MINQEVRSALKLLHEQISPNAPESAGDCWAEFIGAVIEIARQNQNQIDAYVMKGRSGSDSLMSKNEIITRAFREMDFDLEDFGLTQPE